MENKRKLSRGIEKGVAVFCHLRGESGVFMLLSLFMALSSCSKDGPEEQLPAEENNGEVEVTEGTNAELNIDNGSVGLVLDTREIFRKGYMAATATIEFGGHSKFNKTVDIDPFTNLAILSIENDSLTADEKTAFANGVQTTIRVTDESDDVLTTYKNQEQVLDNTNFPLSLNTEKEYIKRPLNLKEESPYLLQIEGHIGVLTSSCSDCYLAALFEANNLSQQFYFESTDIDDVYNIKHLGYGEGSYMYTIDGGDVGISFGEDFINLGGDQVTMPNGPAKFIFEQDDDGWVKIKLKDTDGYLFVGSDRFLKVDYTETHQQRFRFISDNIDWNVMDQGTEYLQPITPPAQLDFAYEATLKNCSSALLTEEVGKTESRTRTTSFSTSESLQLFSSETITAGLKVGIEVGAKVGGDVYGASAEVKASAEVSLEAELSTSETTTSENTISESEEYTTEVSRIRTLQVDPYSGVEVYDAIKSIENVITPFVQTVRISGKYKSGAKDALTGPELATQLQFNFVGGIISKIGSDYVDLNIRGQAIMDEIFEATTEVNDLKGVCDN